MRYIRHIMFWAVYICTTALMPAQAGNHVATINIMSMATSKCLDAYWSAGKSGGPIKQYYCDGTSEQKWILEKVNYYSVSYNTGLIRIRNARYSNLCIEIQNMIFQNRTPVWLVECAYDEHWIKAQIFDQTHGFFHTDYYPTSNPLKRIGLEEFFQRGKSMVTWIKPFNSSGLVLNIDHGELMVYAPHSKKSTGAPGPYPQNFKPNQLFALIKTD